MADERAVGRRLKAARIEAGYESPSKFAPLIGRSTRQVNYYEAGAIPGADVLDKWARVTGKTTGYLLHGPQDEALEQAPEVGSIPRQHHPGVEALAQNAKVRASLGITDADIEWLRGLHLPEGYSIDSPERAVMYLTVKKLGDDLAVLEE